MSNYLFRLICTASLLLLSACASHTPVLYPNEKLTEAGDQQAQTDVASCIDLAHNSKVYDDRMGDTAKETTMGAASGAAAGAVGGAISGSVGSGTLIGAASGATLALISSLFRTAGPDPTFRRYVEQCLVEKGYHPVGWR